MTFSISVLTALRISVLELSISVLMSVRVIAAVFEPDLVLRCVGVVFAMPKTEGFDNRQIQRRKIRGTTGARGKGEEKI